MAQETDYYDEVKDMIADAAGVLFALPLYQLWKKRQ